MVKLHKKDMVRSYSMIDCSLLISFYDKIDHSIFAAMDIYK